MRSAHNRRAARSFAASMKKFMPMPKTKERRGANSSMARPGASAARMVAVIATMRREIEGDRQPCLAAGERVAEEAVGLLGGREAGILPDGPGPVGVHGGAGAAQIGRHAR